MRWALLTAGVAVILAGCLWGTHFKKEKQHPLKTPGSFVVPKAFSSNGPKWSFTPQTEIRPQALGDFQDDIRTAPVATLRDYVLSVQNDPDQRSHALQILVEKEAVEALPAVTAIAQSPVPVFRYANRPHSKGESQTRFEKNLRIRAIEALDRWGTQGIPVQKSLENVQGSVGDQELAFLASVALAGLAEGRPGKLTRMIDKIFDEILEN